MTCWLHLFPRWLQIEHFSNDKTILYLYAYGVRYFDAHDVGHKLLAHRHLEDCSLK